MSRSPLLELDINNAASSKLRWLLVFAQEFGSDIKCSLIDNKITLENVGFIEFELPENSTIELFFGDQYSGAWYSQDLLKKIPVYIVRITGRFNKLLEIKAQIFIADQLYILLSQ